ncbi:hypothetical protein GCM10023322_68110 [Rugosimonospora acidiphila]|uniref:Uncharacterized protein n=1 Tax=Rugosimonospora acidiphila TaxID=556531 RepID=A0ABP9SJ06_9ACTN
MRKRRTHRLDRFKAAQRLSRSDADRLIDRGAPDPEHMPEPGHAGLRLVLEAAAAPARPDELAGERAAVGAFVMARDAARTGRRLRRRGRALRSTGMVAVRVAAGLAILMTGGTALAAETDHLPATAQRGAHNLLYPLGVPAPAPTIAPRLPTPSRSSGAGRVHPPAPSRSSAAPRVTESTGPSPIVLCLRWEGARRGAHPHPSALPDDALKALRAAAKDAADIPSFCAHILSRAPRHTVPAIPPGHHPGGPPGMPGPSAAATHPGAPTWTHGHPSSPPHR